MKLSKNFTREEFKCHGTNCCSGSAPISKYLVNALQQLRDKLGVPLKVRSGFRCLTYNRRINSKDTSQHPLGLAADIEIPANFTLDQVYLAALTIPAFAEGGIGRYLSKNFIHLDVRGTPARWEEV